MFTGFLVRGDVVPKLLSVVVEAAGVTLWPFIFVRWSSVGDESLLRHERIHICQYNELFVVGFLFIYAYDWFCGLLKYRDAREAYRMIRFEQEAREFEGVSGYIALRESYSWTKYRV